LRTINKLINKDIQLRTLTGFFTTNKFSNTNSSIFKILYELDNLEDKSLVKEKKNNNYAENYLEIIWEEGPK